MNNVERGGSAGQRFALMEEKVVLAKLLRAFEIRALDKEEEMETALLLILAPANGVNVVLRPL